MADHASAVTTRLVELIGGVVVGGIVVAFVYGVQHYTEYSAGKHCVLKSACYAAADSDSKDQLDKARDLKDDYGLAELQLKGTVMLLPQGTNTLVMEISKFRWSADFLVSSSQVRVLSGPAEGLALWVNSACLEKQ